VKVPEEWMDAFLKDASLGLTRPAIQRERIRKALQAVLPKVRERLLDGETMTRAWEARPAGKKSIRGVTWAEQVQNSIKAAFDAAFPEEDSDA
jgi:hypothetical protein